MPLFDLVMAYVLSVKLSHLTEVASVVLNSLKVGIVA